MQNYLDCVTWVGGVFMDFVSRFPPLNSVKLKTKKWLSKCQPRLSLGDSKCTMVSLRGYSNCLNISGIDDSFGLIQTHPCETGGTTSKTRSDRLPMQPAVFLLDVWEMGMPVIRIEKSLLPLWVKPLSSASINRY